MSVKRQKPAVLSIGTGRQIFELGVEGVQDCGALRQRYSLLFELRTGCFQRPICLQVRALRASHPLASGDLEVQLALRPLVASVHMSEGAAYEAEVE